MLRVVPDDDGREDLAAGLDEIVREGARRMLAGADTAGRLLEVVVLDPYTEPVAIHAMPLRPKFYRYL